MTYSDFLRFTKWLFIQDCMNQNYFPEGLTKKKLDQVENECKEFIQQYSVETMINDQRMYTDSFTQIHYIMKRNQVSNL